MKNILIDDLNLLLKLKKSILDKNYFLTNNPTVYKYLFIKNKKVNLLSSFINPKLLIKIHKDSFDKFQNLLIDLDKNPKLKKDLEIKSTNLFYNSFRYLPAIYFAGLKSNSTIILKFLKKNQFNKIYFFGEIVNQFYDNEMLYEDLLLKNYNIKIIKYTNSELVRKNLIDKKKNIRFLNSLNIDIVVNQARKIIFKKFYKCKKKNLIIEPLWDLFYYKYDLKKNLIVNLNEKIKNKNFQSFKNKKININLIKIIDKIYVKKKKFFSKKILKKIIIDALEVNYKLNFLIEEVNILIKKFNFDNVIWCCDPDKYIANIIGYFKKKDIPVYGIQHGGSYLLQNYNIHHKHSDFNLCDKFLTYGSSKYLKHKKFIEVGCLRDQFYKKYFNKVKSLDFKNKKIMYVPNPILNDPLSKPSYLKIKLQDDIIDFLRKSKIRPIIKLPQTPDINHYPLLLEKNELMEHFLLVYEKIYKSIIKHQPEIIILDHFSTSIYECLLSKSEIILFLDKLNMPKKDVLHKLKKRAHIIYKFSELEILVNKIFKDKLKKRNNEFYKKFFSKKNEKKLLEILN
mgnify:CR=1 FL=1